MRWFWTGMWLVWILGFVAAPARAQTIGVIVPEGDETLERTIEMFAEDHPELTVDKVADASAAVAASSVAVVQHGTHDEATATAEDLHSDGVPFVVSNASSREVADSGSHVFVGDVTQARRAAHLVAYIQAVTGASSVAVVHDAQLKKYADQVSAKATAIGLEVKTVAGFDEEPDEAFMRGAFEEFDRAPSLNRRARRFARLFSKNRSASAIDQKLGIGAIVVLADGGDSGLAVKVLRDAGVELPIFCTEAAVTDAFLAQAGNDAADVYAITAYSADLANVRARGFVRRFGGVPSEDAVLLYDALEFVASGIEATRTEAGTTAKAVLDDLRSRQVADRAAEGLSGLLYVDDKGVIQRDPWVLLLDRGRFRPAYTQLRPVLDPRQLWEATQGAAEEVTEEAEPVNRRAARRQRQQQRRDVVVAEAAQVLVKGNKVTVGGKTYHLTAVVYTGIDFFRVNEVDVGGQAFDVELYMWFRWQGDVDVDNIGFLNQINTEDALFEVVRQDLDSATRYICYKVKGRFLTPYDLHDFPFDQQRLPLQVSHSTLDSRHLLLVVDHDRLSHDEITAIYPEEWEYLGRRDASATYAPTTTFGDPAYEGLASRSEFSLYQTEIVLNRILFPYLITLFMPLAIMVGISLFVVLIPPSQFDARLTLTMTALLSVVVFHLSQGEDLPNVGYLMRADQYFMVAYLLLFVLIIKTVVVNLLVGRLSDGMVARGEWVFAIVFVPATLLLYGTLSFDSPLEWIADRWLRPPPAEGIDSVVTPDEPTDLTEQDNARIAPEEPAPPSAPPPVQRDANELYAVCNGEVVSLASLVVPITEKMASVEIPYTQAKPGGDQLRDCSGNFLRVSSYVAGQCEDARPMLAASEGVVDWIPNGGTKNVFQGTVKEWEEDGQRYAARTTRDSARWYHKQGLFRPLYHGSSGGLLEPTAAMQAFRNQIKPGMVLWYGRKGQRYTERSGLNKLFAPQIGIVHMGVVHSVQRDEAGDIVSYKLYHGRRVIKGEFDNGITDHKWDAWSGQPPFGNGPDPVVGWAPLLPEAN